jgi:hypothetical protein
MGLWGDGPDPDPRPELWNFWDELGLTISVFALGYGSGALTILLILLNK